MLTKELCVFENFLKNVVCNSVLEHKRRNKSCFVMEGRTTVFIMIMITILLYYLEMFELYS